MTTISATDLRRGDVVLVTAHPDDSFADLIVALDAAPADVAHSGVALGDGRILSAHPFYDGIGFPVDAGGLRVDHVEYFWRRGQRIHRLSVDPAERERAARAVDRYVPGPGGFSLPKVVTVAAVLHALCPSNPIPPEATARVVRRGLDAARAWEDDGDFYCAEFVSTVYGWEFTLADLVPPPWSLDVEVPVLARLTLDVGARLLSVGVSDERERTLWAFIDEVRRSDPTFFGPGPLAAVADLLDGAGDWIRETTAPGAVPGPVDDSLPDLDTVLPPGLVTPRMLRLRHLGGGEPARVRDTWPDGSDLM